MGRTDGRWVGVIPWLLSACGTLAPPSPAKAPSPPAPAAASAEPMSVETVREQLQVAPWEVAVSGVRGEPGPTETVTARNLIDRPVTITSIKVVGAAAPWFALQGLPALPATVPAKGSVSVELALQPPADATPGSGRAVLRFQTGVAAEDGPAADLSALVTSGREPDAEPPLQQIIETLGYAVDVGGPGLRLPEPPAATGDQVTGTLFQRAREAPVAINPVARFSSDGRVPFGYYLPGASPTKADPRRLAVLAEAQHQTLNPLIEPGGFTSFNPGETRFGIWMGPDKRVTYSEPGRNRGKTRGLARIYPLKARGGAAIPDAFLVAFGEAARADYQDVVFVLWNVKLAE